MKILGIDPGLTGGLALLDLDKLTVIPMPVLKLKDKQTLDLGVLVQKLQEMQPDHVCIEQQQSMPKQGLSSTFRTGYHYGVLIGVLAALKVPYETISPRQWKKAMQVPADKSAARHRATQLLPQYAAAWSKAKDDGLAEAALIALYGSTRSP
jgi:Holliday junction resolvasome RuvABC endonuclease subunit